MQTVLLSSHEIATRLASLNAPGVEPWVLRDNALHKTFRFADFSAAFGFMTRAALAAERLNHHPDWSNAWNRVVVSLSTHDAGGITALDFLLAQEMEALADG